VGFAIAQRALERIADFEFRPADLRGEATDLGGSD
jgi:hypothetical protein